jgi:predicted nucleic acid-binding protein
MFVLDTNVISEMRKHRAGRAHPQVTNWLASVREETFYLSTIVFQELELGVLLAEYHQAPQAPLLRNWLNNYVLPSFEDRILPVDMAIARCSATLHVPRNGPGNDTLIAATALVHNMTVVTRNTADFTKTGVAVLNPWQ